LPQAGSQSRERKGRAVSLARARILHCSYSNEVGPTRAMDIYYCQFLSIIAVKLLRRTGVAGFFTFPPSTWPSTHPESPSLSPHTSGALPASAQDPMELETKRSLPPHPANPGLPRPDQRRQEWIQSNADPKIRSLILNNAHRANPCVDDREIDAGDVGYSDARDADARIYPSPNTTFSRRPTCRTRLSCLATSTRERPPGMYHYLDIKKVPVPVGAVRRQPQRSQIGPTS
jgi:hypothetical protein